MLTKCIDWYEVQEEVNETQVLFLRKILNMAAQKACVSKTEKDDGLFYLVWYILLVFIPIYYYIFYYFRLQKTL